MENLSPHLSTGDKMSHVDKGDNGDKGTNAWTNSNAGTNSAILATELLQRQTFCSPNDLYSLQGSSCRVSQIDPQILRSSSRARVANRSLAYSTTVTVYCRHTGILWREEDRMVLYRRSLNQSCKSSIHCTVTSSNEDDYAEA